MPEILIAFSLSNLLFIRDWKRLIYPTNELYHVKLIPDSTEYLGLLFSVGLTGVVFICGFGGVRYLAFGKALWLAKIIFLLIALIALNGLRQQIADIFPASYNYLIFLILAALSAIAVFSLFKWDNYFFESARWFCLILTPLLIFTLLFGVWVMATNQSRNRIPLENQLSALQPKEKPSIKSRVIWIIFDELDYFVPFEKRPVALPEFDRLKLTSLFATNAIPPAYTTRDATASLITGKQVSQSEVISNDDLLLQFADSQATFSEASNIFREARSLRGETAIVGWLHPYDRALGKDLSVCEWYSVDTYTDFEPLPLSSIVFRNFQHLLNSLPFGSRLKTLIDDRLNETAEDKYYLPRHEAMIKATKMVTSDPKIDLAFIHLPFPHPPNYFNAETGEFISPANKEQSRQNTYFDNLVLTDRMLGEIRKNLEDKQLWNDSTIIISSDHQWRVNVYQAQMSNEELQMTDGKEDVRVPFFLKLKGQNESQIYDKPFNTIVTADLIRALMKGELSNVEAVKIWLDKNSTH